ncbi:MAG TPA: ATP-binding protein [Bacteroidales bacterium]
MKTIEISQLQAQFRDKLLSLKSSKKLKNAEIANITGRSESVISELLGNKRAFADSLIYSMMNRLSDYMQESNLITSLRQYNVMMSIAQRCKQASDMRLVVGNTGIGKTVVFRKFAAENKAVYYFKIDRQYTWHKFLLEITRVMGINPEHTSSNALLDAIVRKVEQSSADKPMLIVDEAEILTRAVWRQLKNLYTATEGLLAICIVGITSIKHTLGRMAGLEVVRYNTNQQQTAYIEYFRPLRDDNNIFTTFARRLKLFHIDMPSAADMEEFCRTKGIVNKQVIELACQRWWNYEMADTAIRAMQASGIDLSRLTVEEFAMF